MYLAILTTRGKFAIILDDLTQMNSSKEKVNMEEKGQKTINYMIIITL